MSANVFISFASQDLKVATALCSALESRGFSCWISSRDIAPGDNFQSAIVSAICDSKVMLLVFSANSNSSHEMTKELALASQQNLIVVPLRVEDVAPNAAFAYEFATRQWIDLFVDWERAINQLCLRLARAMPPEAADATTVIAQPLPPAPVAAPKPGADQTAAARKSAAGLLVGIGVAVLLVIGAVVGVPMLAGKKTTAQATVIPSAAAVVSAPTASGAPVAESRAAQLVSASAAVERARPPVQAAPRRTRAELAAARPARLPVASTSDAYICAHGDASDFRTIQACDRKDWAATDDATH